MNSFLKKIVWVIAIVPFIYLATIWKNLPDRVATHFNSQGDPDKFGNKNSLIMGAVLLAVFSLVGYLFTTYSYKFDPKKHAAENKDRLSYIGFAAVVFAAIVSCVIINSASATSGIKLNMRFVFGGMGLLWAFIGNYMHNIKPNYFAGFRLPWTLENEDNWRKTHQIGAGYGL